MCLCKIEPRIQVSFLIENIANTNCSYFMYIVISMLLYFIILQTKYWRINMWSRREW